MSNIQATIARVDIEALRGNLNDAVMTRDYDRIPFAVHSRRRDAMATHR